jgi:hypothetical protein
MRTRQTKTAAFVVATLGAVGAIIPLQNASAAPARAVHVGRGWESCPAGYTCLWEETYFRGRGVGLYGTEPDFAQLPSAFRVIDNKAGSVYNNGHSGPKSVAVLYPDANYRGGVGFTVCRGERVETLLFPGGTSQYHVFSSLKWTDPVNSDDPEVPC